MLKRSFSLLAVCLIGVGLIFSGAFCVAQDAKKPAEKKAVASKAQTPPPEIVIFSPLWKKHTKGPVKFSHDMHVKEHKIACTECHHIYKDGNNVWKKGMPVKKCEECHTEPTVKGEKRLSKELQKKNLKLAFHKNCVGCHKAIKKKDRKTKAPTTCRKCHAKKKK